MQIVHWFWDLFDYELKLHKQKRTPKLLIISLVSGLFFQETATRVPVHGLNFFIIKHGSVVIVMIVMKVLFQY